MPIPQNDDVANQLLVQAERAKLAAASLRAQMGLEAREARSSKGRHSEPKRAPVVKQQQQFGSSSDDELALCNQVPTTVILRNIPVEYTRQMFLKMLDSEGFAGKYDFIYMPRDFQRSFSLGYVFVNFVTPE